MDELIKDLEQYAEQYGLEEMLLRYEDRIITMKNPQLSLYLSNLNGSKVGKHGKIILDSKDIDTICDFSISHSYEESGEQVSYLLKKGSANHILKYASSIYGFCFANVLGNEPIQYSNILIMRRCFEAIINRGDAMECYEFLEWFQQMSNVRGTVNSNGHIIEKDFGYIIMSSFKDLVKKANKVILNSKDAEYNYHVISTLEQLPKWALNRVDYHNHSKVIIESHEPYYNYFYAKDYGKKDGVDIKLHEDEVIHSQDTVYNYLYARDVEGADVLAHGVVVAKNGTAAENYLYATTIEGADKELHSTVIDAALPEDLIELQHPRLQEAKEKLTRWDFTKKAIKILEIDYKMRRLQENVK